MEKEKYEIARKISGKKKYVQKNYVADRQSVAKYLKYRIMRPVLKVYTRFLRLPPNSKPWLSPSSIEILDTLLQKEMTFLEYGSGRSTLYFAERVGQLESIEHHSEWYKYVTEQLNHGNVLNVNYHLIEPDDHLETKKESEKRFKNPYIEDELNYRSYFDFVNQYEDEYFDVILIDGRARVECTRNALKKLKPGGIFIVDNSERERYKPIFNLCKDMKMLNTTTGLTDTTLWFN